jgi:hypothetical protein
MLYLGFAAKPPNLEFGMGDSGGAGSDSTELAEVLPIPSCGAREIKWSKIDDEHDDLLLS